MKYIGAFFEFSRRVLDSAKKGGLPAKDIRKLDNLLTRTGKRNTVLSKGILTSLSAGGATDADIVRFSQMLKSAEERIMDGKEPFPVNERRELSDIFKRSYVSSKASNFFSAQLDELVAEQINEFIIGTRRVEIGVPAKKSAKAVKEEKEQDKKLLRS